jgi:hypothetical protein
VAKSDDDKEKLRRTEDNAASSFINVVAVYRPPIVLRDSSALYTFSSVRVDVGSPGGERRSGLGGAKS